MKNVEIEKSNVENFSQLIKTPKKTVIARSEKQSEYISFERNDSNVISPRTGKFSSSFVAITLLIEKKIDRVILSRPAVEAGKN